MHSAKNHTLLKELNITLVITIAPESEISDDSFKLDDVHKIVSVGELIDYNPVMDTNINQASSNQEECSFAHHQSYNEEVEDSSYTKTDYLKLDKPSCLQAKPTHVVQYIRFPVLDNGLDLFDSHLDAFIRTMNFAQLRQSKVLVHCKEGRSRSSSFILAFLLRNGWKLKNAFEHLKRCRPCVQPRYQWFDQLMRMELELYSENSLQHHDNYVPVLL
jgi:protein tyrosine phosphatase